MNDNEDKQKFQKTSWGVLNYSYLRASMGFKSAALRAGYTPKTIPINAEKKKEISTEVNET